MWFLGGERSGGRQHRCARVLSGNTPLRGNSSRRQRLLRRGDTPHRVPPCPTSPRHGGNPGDRWRNPRWRRPRHRVRGKSRKTSRLGVARARQGPPILGDEGSRHDKNGNPRRRSRCPRSHDSGHTRFGPSRFPTGRALPRRPSSPDEDNQHGTWHSLPPTFPRFPCGDNRRIALFRPRGRSPRAWLLPSIQGHGGRVHGNRCSSAGVRFGARGRDHGNSLRSSPPLRVDRPASRALPPRTTRQGAGTRGGRRYIAGLCRTFGDLLRGTSSSIPFPDHRHVPQPRGQQAPPTP